MAAAFWAGVLLAELAIAGATAWSVRSAVAGSLGVLLALWLAGVLLLQPLLVLIAFGLSGMAARDASRPLRLRTLIAESLALMHLALRMSVHRPGQQTRRGNPPGRTKRPPILLIHGIVCNAALWGPLQRKLIAMGFDRVDVMELRPLFADIEAHAVNVAHRLREIHGRDGRPIVIVAHSMGGLVARAALRAVSPGTIARIVTLGTPHHGTAIACHVPLTPTRQMCPASPWLQRLNAEQEGRLTVPITSVYSLEDTLIAPARSAELAGAHVVRLSGLGHLGLAAAPRALARVVEALRQE